jgi:hypothetical protein
MADGLYISVVRRSAQIAKWVAADEVLGVLYLRCPLPLPQKSRFFRDPGHTCLDFSITILTREALVYVAAAIKIGVHGSDFVMPLSRSRLTNF